MGYLLKRLVGLHLGLLALMAAFRAAFYLVHAEPALRDAYAADLPAAAWMGARFDLLVLGWLTLPVALWLLFETLRGAAGGPRRWLTRAARWYFVGFLVISVFCAGDIGFWAYYQDHFNVMVFGFHEDHTMAVFGMIWDMFPVPLILLGAVAFVLLLRLLVRALLAPDRAPETWGRPVPALACAFLVLLSAAAAARGSLGRFPLRARYASVSEHAFVNATVLNGAYAMKEALKARMEEESGPPLAERLGHPDPVEAVTALTGATPEGADLDALLEALTPGPWPPLSDAAAEGQRPHVVLVMMEGQGSHLLRFHAPPDFDLLGGWGARMEEGVLFPRFLPVVNTTVGSTSAASTGLPQTHDGVALPQSRHATKAFRTAAARAFREAGYETHYLYGGQTTWRKLDRFLPRQGFDTVEGLRSILRELELGADAVAFWKTHDEHLWEFLRRRLREAERPQFWLVLTVSNHPPFDKLRGTADLPPLLPPAELDARPEAVDGRLSGIQYAAHALGDWMDDLEEDGTLARTVVAVTGDHNTGDYAHYPEENALDHYGVPLWLRVPQAWAPPPPPDRMVPASYLDLLPTLLHLAAPDVAAPVLGRSLWDDARPPYAWNAAGLHLSPQGAVMVDDFGERRYRWDAERPWLLRAAEDGAADLDPLLAWRRALLAVGDHLVRLHEEEPVR